MVLLALLRATSALAQSAPGSPDRPWHGPAERSVQVDARRYPGSGPRIDSARTYTLADLIDVAESHNPGTRVAWERARAQAAALGVARSELYPTLAAAAFAGASRSEVYLQTQFVRQTFGDFGLAFDLSYTVFDSGARSARIAAARAEVLAANFAFNDTHRRLIDQVQQAYYQLLTASGQEDAARASLTNAEAVQQAAEERLANGLATLPDVLEARSAAAQAEYELQSILGAQRIAAGNLATALGAPPATPIQVQSLGELAVPESMGDSVEVAIDRATAQRPDLLQQMADLHSAKARVKEARAALYPSLSFSASPTAQSSYGREPALPWGHTSGITGAVSLGLNWSVFDGGARKSRLAQAEADVRSRESQVHSSRDQLANEVWAAYTNLSTALRQRQAARALLDAARQSYDAALESYDYGVRNLLDVTAAQRTLAQARSTDVLARTQVLAALADLAFRAGDSIQPRPARADP